MNQLMQKVKRASPKKGRRAISNSGSAKDANSTDDPPSRALEADSSTVPPPKPPRKKAGGWADSSARTAKGRHSSGAEDDSVINTDPNNDKDITTIPDLDDFQEEDLAIQVAKAPNIAVNRVATYKELDRDLLKHSAFSTLDDIDLKVLMKFLTPEAETKEEDIPWTWDMLLADVSSRITVADNNAREET